MREQVAITLKKGTLYVQPIKENVIRCCYTTKELKEPSEMIETPLKTCSDYQIRQTLDGCILNTKRIALTVDLKKGICQWKNPENGTTYLEELSFELTDIPVMRYTTMGEKPVIERVKTVDGERNFIRNQKAVQDRMAYRGKLMFRFAQEEGIYGLGQAEEGIYDHRHQNQYLYQHNMRIPMPFMVSSKGYGILVDCRSLMTFNDDVNGSYLFMDTISQLDFYFITGEDTDEIIANYRELTGTAVMLPKWAFGYVQSKERYSSARELVDIVSRYRELEVPLDLVVQDWLTWEDGHWGEKIVDKKRFGDLKECMDKIHEMNAHTMVSVWPNMNQGTVDHTEFLKSGYLLNDLCTYDAFNEKAREMYWKQAEKELFNGGFDSWWCDSTEPFSGPDWNGENMREPWERFRLVGEEHKQFLDPEVANFYAVVHAKGMYENQRKVTEEKRVLNLIRSGYSSIQKYGAMLWSGDTAATWETMRKQIVEGLNMGLSGYPYWTLDIGAFFTVNEKWQNRGCNSNQDPTPKWFWRGDFEEGIHDKGYQELYTRWMQFGCFLPMYRSHGTDTPREIWNFGEKGNFVYDSIEKYIELRYTLMPYVYSLAGAVHLEHATMMRSLLFDFAGDKKALEQKGEYLFGKSILVNPVTEPMYYAPGNQKIDVEKKWNTYLPAGTMWYDFWENTVYTGGTEVITETPLDVMPVFVKAGSIIPMNTEKIQYAMQECKQPMLLKVYPGRDACFCLYEDEGDNYQYEEGRYSIIPISWNEKEQTLTIGKRQGEYSGMKKKRQFLIRTTDGREVLYNYTGEEIQRTI